MDKSQINEWSFNMVDIINESVPNAPVVEIDTPLAETIPSIEETTVEAPYDEVFSDSAAETPSEGESTEVTEAIDEKKNYLLEGPLSHRPSTRFRQMLARPGIIVSTTP
ncbi:hypothetical protein M422DRAFT_269336 [Sphaerobolus stellatus SS14]|uniref:Uncharacterized protein n=1 Tax=Sphaerobolus stellatus (strain SS14) TaxID=990650 RepID=A0A0C9UK52_SPHS4|nr:hypothetical protein M422DRAFT_269336 [Sphaerobolus stellatus SS14]